ncbi:MAG: chromosomal replication initiator protein DnaA [Proteobacteria bacterium]|nr:chromosomal replication initiator protein DnaA [Pseudomonadota bacterium]
MFKPTPFTEAEVAVDHSVAAGEANPAILVWERVQRRLRAELGEDVYTSWFKCLELAEVRAPLVTLSVPTKFLRNWIQQHFAERIAAHFARENAELSRISIVVRVVGPRPAPRVAEPQLSVPVARPAVPAIEPQPVAAEPRKRDALDDSGQVGSPLDKRLALGAFQVGRSNIMAHAAAMQVVQARPGEMPVFNPLYVHASVGLGKTHLLQGAAQAIEAAGRRVLYLTAERFMYGFAASLKAQNALAFKEQLRGIDVLVIDDAQFLHGPKIQQEFCHTLNALIDAGRQVIVAADRAPADLESLEERVQSRLAGGLVVEIGALDDALRIKILESRIQAARVHLPGFDVAPEVVAHVARLVTTNGRDLEGAVNRLLAHATLTGGTLDIPAAEEAIRDLIRHREPRRVKIEDIQRLVANHYNVSRADILSSRRTANVVRPRQIAMFLAKSLTLRSLPEIGRRFGGRDHTTVLHAVRKIEGMVNADTELAGEIEHLKRMLQE